MNKESSNPFSDPAESADRQSFADNALTELFHRDIESIGQEDVFVRKVLQRWEASQKPAVVGRIGVRTVSLAVGWAAALALMLTLAFMQSEQDTAHTAHAAPHVGVLVQDVNHVYNIQSARISQIVERSSAMMDIDAVLQMVNSSLAAHPQHNADASIEQ